MNKLKIFTLLTMIPLFSFGQQTETTPTNTVKTVGFVGGSQNCWSLGSQESMNTWLKWCDLHSKKDVSGILDLAFDSIRIEGPNNLTITGKENLKVFLTEWFENYDVIVDQEWGAPLNFVDENGKGDDGNWIMSGHKLKSSKDGEMTIEDNHANIYVKEGKVRFFKVYNHSKTTSKMTRTTFSVDMSGYIGKFDNVCLNGTFNDWCGSCNTMTDANNDGVYEITLDVPSGEIEYKFTIDGWAGQESFEAGTSCTKTTQEFTNRVASIESETSLPTVCFNSCSACD